MMNSHILMINYSQMAKSKTQTELCYHFTYLNCFPLGGGHSKSKFSIFCALSQNYQHFLEKKNNVSILNQIVRETENWHQNFIRPSSFGVLIKTLFWSINSRTAWPTKILMPFLRFSDNLLHENHISFQKSIDNFEIVHPQNMQTFGWFGVLFPLKCMHLGTQHQAQHGTLAPLSVQFHFQFCTMITTVKNKYHLT